MLGYVLYVLSRTPSAWYQSDPQNWTENKILFFEGWFFLNQDIKKNNHGNIVNSAIQILFCKNWKFSNMLPGSPGKLGAWRLRDPAAP